MQNDPCEWTNRVRDPKYAEVLAEHRRRLPKSDVPPAPGSAHRVLTYNRKTGEAVWEGKPIATDASLPE